MAKHGGCFLCGSMTDEVLISIPDMLNAMSIAICHACYSLSVEELRTRINQILSRRKKRGE